MSSNKMANPNAANEAHKSLGIGLSDHDFVDEAYMHLLLDGFVSDDENSLLQSQFNGIDIPTGIEAPIPWFMGAAVNNKTVNTRSFKTTAGKGEHSIGLSDHDFVDEKAYMDLFQDGLVFDDEYAFLHSQFNSIGIPTSSHKLSSKMATGASSSSSTVPWYPPESSNNKRKYWNDHANNNLASVDLASNCDPYAKMSDTNNLESKSSRKEKSSLSEGSEPKGSKSSTKDHEILDGTVKSSQLFKQFDTVEDFSDHHYFKNGSAVTQQPKNWAKRIHEEWKILEKDLPNTIYVRAYESRMDLMRAVIVGAQGTPYHDGLFFFDIFFPRDYPSVPPHVHYHSGGLRINPNLYDRGKVCLSLLNTWTGSGNENWVPNVSTMLQVLVSIQGLILNEKPYFNEPGFASSAGSAIGEQNSQNYNENAFILSLKTMVYTVKKPPKHFEELVTCHFREHAQDILGACKLYIESGVHAGSSTKGGGESAKAKVKKCSSHFQGNVASHITMLVQAFVQIGAKDCDKFLSCAKGW